MIFLDLCKDLISDTGLGGEPDLLETVVGQTGDLNNAVRYIRDAALQIDNLWFDWKYLWFEHIANFTVAMNNAPPMPAFGVRRWDRETFYLDKSGATPIKLRFEEWDTFRDRTGVFPTGKAAIITVKPDNTLLVEKLNNATYSFSANGWRRPVVLAADDDEPLMPEEYHRIIVCRGKINYASKEDAPEILEGAEAEYMDILDKLQSDQLEGHYLDRMSTQDVDVSQEVHGFQYGGSQYVSR
jgi:hypothetical protein